MIEILDNAIQVFAISGCAVWAGMLALRRRSQAYTILSCFYITFALGCLYWLVYLLMMTYTPRIFYVSDLSWAASFLFLLTLELSIRTEPEKAYKAPLALAAPIAIMGLTAYFCLRWGDYIITLVWGSLMAACGYFALHGLLYACKQSGNARRRVYLHSAVLFIIVAEHVLWLLSPFATSNTINPYVLCDLVVTLALSLLLPAMKKVTDL